MVFIQAAFKCHGCVQGSLLTPLAEGERVEGCETDRVQLCGSNAFIVGYFVLILMSSVRKVDITAADERLV